MPEIGSAFVSILPSAKGFGKDLNKQVGAETDKSGSSIGKRFGSTFTTGAGKIMRAGAKFTGVAVAGTLGTALVKGFGRLKAIDQAESKLRGLGYTAKEITGIMDSATEAVTGTAFGLDEAATVSASALASGVKEGKELTKYLTLVGDAATQGGTSFAEMGSIMNKMTATGKVGMENLNQLSERGIGVMGWLAEEYGVTGDELSKMVSKGQVDVDTLQKVLKEKIGGAAQESGKTFSGAMANMQAALGRLGAKILAPIFRRMPAVFSGIGSAIDKVGPIAERLGEAMGDAFAAAAKSLKSLLKALKPVVKEIGNKLAPVMERVNQFFRDHPELVRGAATALGILATALTVAAIAGGALSIAMSPITLIIVAVAALGAGIAYLWKNSETFRTVVTKLGEVLKRFGIYLYKTVIPAVVDLAQKVAKHLRPVWVSLGKYFNGTILPILKKVAEKLREWWPTISKVIQFVAKMIGKFIEFQAWLAGKIIPVLIALNRVGFTAVIKGITLVINWFGRIFTTLRNFHNGMVNATRAVGNFASGVARHIKNVLNWFKNLPGRIRNALGNVGSWLYNAGKDLIQGFIDGIGSMFGSVKNKLGDLTGKLTSWKGPPEKDAKLLFGAGRLIIQGLNDGFEASVPDVRRTLQGITHEIEATALRSPSLAVAGASMSEAPAPADARSIGAEVAAALHNMGLTLKIGNDAAGRVVLAGQNVIDQRR